MFNLSAAYLRRFFILFRASTHVSTFSWSNAHFFLMTRSTFSLILTITFKARGILESPLRMNWASFHASWRIMRTYSSVFLHRLPTHAALTRIHFSKILRKSWETKEKRNNLIEETYSNKYVSAHSHRSVSTHEYQELVPYRKEDAPDACYASAVAYSNTVHHRFARDLAFCDLGWR